MSDWRPIDTAPKDGTRLLLYGPDFGHHPEVVGWWSAKFDDWICEFGRPNPTRWMPLPGPPDSDPLDRREDG